MSTNRRTMYQIVILLMSYTTEISSMSDITQNLLTPSKEEGEACGYESCPPIQPDVLNVHVVPSTIGELGYTRTFEQHFTGRDEFFDTSNINMKRILDFVITELWNNPERKFTFSDLPYLFKWWKSRNPTVRRMFYQLLRQGRIHIVGGGWSMTDESCSNYHTVIDHFTYSLRKLNNTFLDCARPHVSWQVESLGHTSEFASLTAQMGFDGHFINPISYDDELTRMKNKNLEFLWRGSPDLGSSSDIYTHKLFDGYWSPPGFCFGSQCSDPLIITSDSMFNNLEERVKLFVESMKYRQSPHYATNHIMVVMGQRFGYYDAPMWFDNIDRLITGVRHLSPKLGFKVYPYYSTPICYLKAVYESNITLNIEKGDFVPVSYDKNTHFSGMYSSRPTVKYAIRLGHLYLQISKQLQVLGRLKEYNNFFEDFHWIVGVMADRNILSGGMRPHVRDYYIHKLYQSVRTSETVIKDGITHLLNTPTNIHYSRCLFNISYCEQTNKDSYHIVIYNPLAWPVRIPVRLPSITNSQYSVYGPESEKIKSVIMRIPTSLKRINKMKTFSYELVFFADNVPPLGLHTYYIEKVNRTKRSPKLIEINLTDDSKANKDLTIDSGVNKDKITNTKNNDINNEVQKDMTIKNLLINHSKLPNETKKNNDNVLKKDIDTGELIKDKTIERLLKDSELLSKKEKDTEVVLKKINELLKTDKSFRNDFKLLDEIFIDFRKKMDALKKDNLVPAFMFQKNNNKHSKRDVDDYPSDIEEISNKLRSLLKKHKNAKDSDKIPKLAKNLKKYLNYNTRINVLGQEIERRLKEFKKTSLNNEFYNLGNNSSQKKNLSTDGKKDTESKIYGSKMKTKDRYEENKNISKRSVPLYKDEEQIYDDLEENEIIEKDNDTASDDYVKKILFNLIRRTYNNKLKKIKMTDEFTTEKDNKVEYYFNKAMDKNEIVPLYRYEEQINDDLEENEIIEKDNDTASDDYVKKILFSLIRRTYNNKLKKNKMTDEFTTEKDDKVEYYFNKAMDKNDDKSKKCNCCKDKTRKYWHDKLRLKRMTNEIIKEDNDTASDDYVKRILLNLIQRKYNNKLKKIKNTDEFTTERNDKIEYYFNKTINKDDDKNKKCNCCKEKTRKHGHDKLRFKRMTKEMNILDLNKKMIRNDDFMPKSVNHNEYVKTFTNLKRKIVNLLQKKVNTNLNEKNNTNKFTMEKKHYKNKIIHENNNENKKCNCRNVTTKKHLNDMKKARLKRMYNENNKLDIYNFIPDLNENYDFMPKNYQDDFQAKDNHDWLETYAQIINTMNHNQNNVMPSINLDTRKTHASQDNMPYKIYDRSDSNKIHATTEYFNLTSEEDTFTGKVEFSYRPLNSTLNFTFPKNFTYNKNNEFNSEITESPQDVTTNYINCTNTARPERSLIKKIKNAKKKYLRRQTNNLKIDDEGLLKNNNYDDDVEEVLEYDEEEDKNTKENDDREVKVQYVPIRTTIRTTTSTVVTTRSPPTTASTTATSATIKRSAFMSSNDYYIGNQYINITLSPSRRISHIRLVNGVTMSLDVSFYYYASDDPVKLGRPHDKKPGAFVFNTMDNKPVLIDEKVKVEVLKSELVEELHVTGSLISYLVRIYNDTPYFELTWICSEIPVKDGIGKDVFVRYQTDLDTSGIFHTDSNGRQTMKRVFGQRDHYIPTEPFDIPGNYYPVTSKITIEDVEKLIRFSVFNDRTQGGTSTNGNIDLMINRRLLTDDAGIQAFLNETETVAGKHYFYLTKLTSRLNRIFEKKLEKELGYTPQIFVPNKVLAKHNWARLKKQFKGLNKKLPLGLNILTLQTWNDGNLLLRIENYLEKSDIIKSGIKKIVLKDLFSRFDIIGVRETTLGANVWLEDYYPLIWKVNNGKTRNDEKTKEVDENSVIVFKPQQIRTFVIRVEYKNINRLSV